MLGKLFRRVGELLRAVLTTEIGYGTDGGSSLFALRFPRSARQRPGVRPVPWRFCSTTVLSTSAHCPSNQRRIIPLFPRGNTQSFELGPCCANNHAEVGLWAGEKRRRAAALQDASRGSDAGSDRMWSLGRWSIGRNLVEVVVLWGRLPRVVPRTGQPRAGGRNPFGIRDG